MAGPEHTPDFNLFRAVEVFMAVAEMAQVTNAARALGITQSAASQHLRNLELAFGMRLLDRSQRPIRLTHAGEVLQRHGYRILNEIEDLRSELRHLKSSAIPVLRVGLLASIATTLTPGLLEFVGRHLKIPELILSAGLASDHGTALASRAIDIAITSEHLSAGEDHRAIPILEEPFLLVLPQSWVGDATDVQTLARDLSLVRFSAATPVGRRTDQHLQRCRLHFPRRMEADRASMVVAGVATGKCFAILTPSLLIDALAEGMELRLAPLPFAGFRRSIQVVARSGDLGGIPEALAHECGRILKHHFDLRFAEFDPHITYFGSDAG